MANISGLYKGIASGMDAVSGTLMRRAELERARQEKLADRDYEQSMWEKRLGMTTDANVDQTRRVTDIDVDKTRRVTEIDAARYYPGEGVPKPAPNIGDREWLRQREQADRLAELQKAAELRAKYGRRGGRGGSGDSGASRKDAKLWHDLYSDEQDQIKGLNSYTIEVDDGYGGVETKRVYRPYTEWSDEDRKKYSDLEQKKKNIRAISPFEGPGDQPVEGSSTPGTRSTTTADPTPNYEQSEDARNFAATMGRISPSELIAAGMEIGRDSSLTPEQKAFALKVIAGEKKRRGIR